MAQPHMADQYGGMTRTGFGTILGLSAHVPLRVPFNATMPCRGVTFVEAQDCLRVDQGGVWLMTLAVSGLCIHSDVALKLELHVNGAPFEPATTSLKVYHEEDLATFSLSTILPLDDQSVLDVWLIAHDSTDFVLNGMAGASLSLVRIG